MTLRGKLQQYLARQFGRGLKEQCNVVLTLFIVEALLLFLDNYNAPAGSERIDFTVLCKITHKKVVDGDFWGTLARAT